MSKVYCSLCKYYTNRCGAECWAVNNLREQSSWLHTIIVTITPPSEKNCNNDCLDFEAMPDKNTGAWVVADDRR